MPNVSMTHGIYNAYSRRVDPAVLHHICKSCGFYIPKYPGRYPRNCPSCGASILPPVPMECEEAITALMEGRMTVATAVDTLLENEEEKRDTPLGRDLDDLSLHINGMRLTPMWAGSELSVDNDVIILFFYPDVAYNALETIAEYAKGRGFDAEIAKTGGEEKTGWAITLVRTRDVAMATDQPVGLVDVEVPMAGDAEPGVI